MERVPAIKVLLLPKDTKVEVVLVSVDDAGQPTPIRTDRATVA